MARPPVNKLAPTNTTASVRGVSSRRSIAAIVDLKPYSAKQATCRSSGTLADDSSQRRHVLQAHRKPDHHELGANADIGVPGYSFNIIAADQRRLTPRCTAIEAGCSTSGRTASASARSTRATGPRASSAGEERPLEGIAPPSTRVGVMYERGPWSLGATADHTDGFVTAINVLGAGFNERRPDHLAHAHSSYHINDAFTVSLEGQNLLDDEQTYSINGNPQLLSQGYYRYGRSANIGVSFRF
jgi:hypothetical protein